MAHISVYVLVKFIFINGQPFILSISSQLLKKSFKVSASVPKQVFIYFLVSVKTSLVHIYTRYLVGINIDKEPNLNYISRLIYVILRNNTGLWIFAVYNLLICGHVYITTPSPNITLCLDLNYIWFPCNNSQLRMEYNYNPIPTNIINISPLEA